MKIAVASLVSQPRKNACPAPGKIPITSATGAKPSSTSATTWARITASERKPSSATAPSAPRNTTTANVRRWKAPPACWMSTAGASALSTAVAGELPVDRRGASPLRSASYSALRSSDPAGWRRNRGA